MVLPSLYSLIDVRLLWCGPDSVGSLVPRPGLWGFLGCFFPVPRMWACLLVLLLAPGCGVLLVLLNCLCWLPVCGLIVLFIRWFCVRAEAPFPLI